jgi:hypothetical protein
MGTAMRFITALGGVVLIAFALGLLGYPIIQTIAEPEYADFPGGAAGLVVMLLLIGSLPFGGGVLLIRRAVRGGQRDQTITDDVRGRAESSTPDPPPLVADVVESAPPIEFSMDVAAATDVPAAIEPRGTTMPVAPVPIEASTPVQPLQTTRDTEDVPPQRRRRTWLAMLGAIGLVRTSAGLAFVTALVSVPAITIWRDAVPFLGPSALTIFSLIDPLANIRQRSWWAGAFVSAASWFVLFLVTAAATDIVSDQPDVPIRFILPVMAYPAAMALSGLIRFVQWLGRH